jgi:hypothetical protein
MVGAGLSRRRPRVRVPSTPPTTCSTITYQVQPASGGLVPVETWWSPTWRLIAGSNTLAAPPTGLTSERTTEDPRDMLPNGRARSTLCTDRRSGCHAADNCPTPTPRTRTIQKAGLTSRFIELASGRVQAQQQISVGETARETRIARSPEETGRTVSGDEQRSPAAALGA